MELIVITHPEMLPGEAAIINQLFEHGLVRLHVRKPESTPAELRGLLGQIEPAFHERVALHQHHELAEEFGITGLHFTEKNRHAQRSETWETWKNSGFILSTSIHDPGDLKTLPHCFDYAFLGPVFDSISKQNYKAVLSNEFQLDRFNFPGQLIALGGIDDTKLDTVASLGFDGVAVLGIIWMETANAIERFRLLATSSGLKPGGAGIGTGPRLKPGAGDRETDDALGHGAAGSPVGNQLPRHTSVEAGHQQSKTKAIHCPQFQPGDPKQYLNPDTDFDQNPDLDSDSNLVPANKAAFIDRLHFISNETGTMSHIDSIRLALEAGCQWIQLRVKNRTEEEVLPIAREAKKLCDRYEAKLVINDFPRVALEVKAYGLHLGLTDMPVPEARALVGEQIVIGGTANSWEDIGRRVGEGSDYIGLGPFRFTNTKQNLSPILGIEGYDTLMRQMREAGHSTPIIAIGGITPDDISELCAAGLHGIAMSAAITGAANPQETFYQIQQALC